MSNHSPIHSATLPQASAPLDADPTADPTVIQKININTASVQELTSLPGIGQVLAQRIVDHRSKYGPFDAIGELANVEGIGLQKLEAIWQYITV